MSTKKLMMACISASLQSGFTSADFSYTGTYTWVDDGSGNWRLKFLSSGTFTPSKAITVDLFLVGGGASGGSSSEYAGGSGSGYTATHTSIALSAGTAYSIVVGAEQTSEASGGNSSSAFTYSVNGGGIRSGKTGGNGGSGAGSGGGSSDRGDGGTNGGNGGGTYKGTGQGTTTREFGEAGGDVYAGAGGGISKAGGVGGGGTGASSTSTAKSVMNGTNGLGGGAGAKYASGTYFGNGGSGIAIIRNHR